MKNAMKKIMSLVLVAMILVSALPFAASADETVPAVPTLLIHLNGTQVKTVEGSVGSTASYEDCLAVAGVDLSAVDVTDSSWKKHGGAWASLTSGVVLDEAAYYYVYIKTAPKTTTPEPEAPAPEAPTAYPISIDVDGEMKALTDKISVTYAEILQMVGVKAADVDFVVYEGDNVQGTQYMDAEDSINLTGATRVFVFTKKEETTQPTQPQPSQPTTPTTPSNKVVDEEWMKDIYLYIYTNNDIIAPAKRVLLNNYMVIKDHTLNQAEILSVVDDYYKATNSNNGIIWKGSYMEDANIDAINFVDGRNEVPFTNLDVERSSHSVIIKVRVTGVTATSTSNADKTNPKTGDTIMVPVAVMTVSASLLAVAFYMNKKRAF